MAQLLVVFIALGWVAFAVWWGRNRLTARQSYGYASNSYGTQSTMFATPRTEHMARLRRQQVLAALVGIAILTLIMTRLWSVVWVLQIVSDLAVIAFAFAWYSRSSAASRPAVHAAVAEPEFEELEESWEYEPLYADGSSPEPEEFEDGDEYGLDFDVEPVGAHF